VVKPSASIAAIVKSEYRTRRSVPR